MENKNKDKDINTLTNGKQFVNFKAQGEQVLLNRLERNKPKETE